MNTTSDSCCPSTEVNARGKGWLGRAPTPDEREILSYLLKRRSLPQSILHIGVGNSLLYQALGDVVKQGLTLDGQEEEFSREMGLPTILANKYATETYSTELLPCFDCIVDVNIRSYACCDKHFRDYMLLLANRLSSNGVLLTSRRGLAYRKPTSLTELRQLCPQFHIKPLKNVILMLPIRLRGRYSFTRLLWFSN
jgi:hypothetical protein